MDKSVVFFASFFKRFIDKRLYVVSQLWGVKLLLLLFWGWFLRCLFSTRFSRFPACSAFLCTVASCSTFEALIVGSSLLNFFLWYFLHIRFQGFVWYRFYFGGFTVIVRKVSLLLLDSSSKGRSVRFLIDSSREECSCVFHWFANFDCLLHPFGYGVGFAGYNNLSANLRVNGLAIEVYKNRLLRIRNIVGSIASSYAYGSRCWDACVSCVDLE